MRHTQEISIQSILVGKLSAHESQEAAGSSARSRQTLLHKKHIVIDSSSCISSFFLSFISYKKKTLRPKKFLPSRPMLQLYYRTM